jgi:myo-inositol 2-dehydrogenase/D-chiro-inositol 1-dehydrogenase
MRPKVNVGVIGAGRIGRVHAENLAYHIPDARLAAITDVDLKTAERCAAEYDIATVAKDYRTILDSPDIDAVLICSGTDTHSRIIEDAAEAGKHIFCEKPIDYNLSRIDKALQKVDRAGVKLQIGFQRRYDPNFIKVRTLLREGTLGKLYILRITSRDPEPPPISYIKVSGGLFLDMMIHDFDMARYLVGSEVEEIYTAAGAMVDPEIGKAGDVDTAVVTLKFRNGIIGTIDCCRKSGYGYDQRVELFGSGGMVRVENELQNRTSLTTGAGVREEPPLFFFVERYREAFVLEIKEFSRCILEDEIPAVTGIDGRIPVVMGQAAKKSLEENRPVKLTELSPLLTTGYQR